MDDREDARQERTADARPPALRPAGRVARGFGLTYAGLILAASIITSLTIGRVEVATPLLVAVAVALGIRSLMVGIRIRGSELVIVSWFRTYRFPRERIQDAVIDDYSGWFTNFAPSRRIRILELEIDGRDREFSCTAMTRRAAIAVRAELARTIGLEVGDVNEERHPMPVLGRWGNG